jgi:hypothetical protein
MRGKQLTEPLERVISDAGERIGNPSPDNVAYLGRDD